MPDKAVFVSAVLLWETTILQRQKWHPVYFHLNQRENLLMVKFSQVCTCNKWAGNMLMFHVDVNMKQLGIASALHESSLKKSIIEAL